MARQTENMTCFLSKAWESKLVTEEHVILINVGDVRQRVILSLTAGACRRALQDEFVCVLEPVRQKCLTDKTVSQTLMSVRH
jgi:hypothetical protein